MQKLNEGEAIALLNTIMAAATLEHLLTKLTHTTIYRQALKDNINRLQKMLAPIVEPNLEMIYEVSPGETESLFYLMSDLIKNLVSLPPEHYSIVNAVAHWYLTNNTLRMAQVQAIAIAAEKD